MFMNEDASKSDQARGLGPGLDSLLLDTWWMKQVSRRLVLEIFHANISTNP